jgi:integrase
MTKSKRSKKLLYWIVYRLPNGKQRWERVGDSIKEAKDAEGKRRGQKRENRIFEMLPESKMTFAELIKWYLGQEKLKALAYHKTLKSNMKHFEEEFGDHMVNGIKQLDLENFQIKLKNASYSDAYIDQIIESIKNAVYKAWDNDLIGGDCLKPFRKTKKLMKRGDNARKRVLTYQEYEKLVDYLPIHSKGIFAFAYWTGCRAGEILTLRWENIDIANRLIHLSAAMTKEKKPKTVPISRLLRSILMQIKNKEGYVFKYAGKPIKDYRDGLKRACEKAAIPYGRFEENGLIFHDLRRTFATDARKAKVARNVIMAMMGHSDGGNMNARYDQVDQNDLIEATDQIEDYRKSVSRGVSRTKNNKAA